MAELEAAVADYAVEAELDEETAEELQALLQSSMEAMIETCEDLDEALVALLGQEEAERLRESLPGRGLADDTGASAIEILDADPGQEGDKPQAASAK